MFQILSKYGVYLKEDEKCLLNSAFAFKQLPDIFDIAKLFTLLDSLSEPEHAQNIFNSEWERKIYRKLGDFIKNHNLTIKECFNLFDENKSGLINKEEFGSALEGLQVDISERELSVLISLADVNKNGLISLNEFAKKFWEAYSFENLKYEDDLVLTKEQELEFYKAILKKMKENTIYPTLEQAFKILAERGLGFVTLMDLQSGLLRHFQISLPKQKLLLLFKFIDQDEDGIISLKDFTQFYRDFDLEINKNIRQFSKTADLQYQIFEHMFITLKQRNVNSFLIILI